MLFSSLRSACSDRSRGWRCKLSLVNLSAERYVVPGFGHHSYGRLLTWNWFAGRVVERERHICRGRLSVSHPSVCLNQYGGGEE